MAVDLFTNSTSCCKTLTQSGTVQCFFHVNGDNSMAQPRAKYGIGASALRLEDDRFIRGKGIYTDDLKPDGVLHAHVVRSPHANATFEIRDLAAAKAAPGVHLVMTAKDLAHLAPLKTSQLPVGAGTKIPTRDIPILCSGHVAYVGDAIAFIVADTLQHAEDAAELIDVRYRDRDVVVDARLALKEGAPGVGPGQTTNLADTCYIGSKATTDAAFANAHHVTKIAFWNNRLISNYMETRSAIGEWKPDENRFHLTFGSQGVHSIRNKVAETVFKIGKDGLRAITKDVGGGFGPKAWAYREYPLVLEAAKRLGKPVKWTATRTEHFLTDAHGRDNHVEAEMALDMAGRFLGLRVNLIANMGAYLSENALDIPRGGITMSTGLYDVPAIDVSIRFAYTNTTPVDAYRGAGRPEAAFLIERLVDECARDLGMERDEIRHRNFPKPESFPFRTATGRTYDVGEFEGHMVKALANAGWSDFQKRLETSKADGKLRGFGFATYVEICAFEGNEPAVVTLRKDGMVELRIGTQSNGQGHATAYAQLAAIHLGLPIERIDVRQGDTDELPSGGGTGGSRSIPIGGVSADRAGKALAVNLKSLAADELEAGPEDIELVDGNARVVGTDRQIALVDLALKAAKSELLTATGDFFQIEGTYPNGTHVCEIEIDPETGCTQILRYSIVDDFGVVVNPILLAGQIHGGLAQGIGQALMEAATYSDDGQLLTASFMDYAVPRAADLPFFEFDTRNVPSTTNALGVKGAGEAATIGSTPAVMNAVIDALWRGHGIRHLEMPATPCRIWQAIEAAKTKAG